MSNQSQNNQAFVTWFTGLSGAGKTTIAKELIKLLEEERISASLLDGDVVRAAMENKDFSPEARQAHIRCMGFAASQLQANGICVVASFISPHQQTREFVRGMCNNFFEVYVSTPLEVCKMRDPKGLYARVEKGEIKNFTGIDSPYEAPDFSEIVIGELYTPESAAEAILEKAKKKSNWITTHYQNDVKKKIINVLHIATKNAHYVEKPGIEAAMKMIQEGEF